MSTYKQLSHHFDNKKELNHQLKDIVWLLTSYIGAIMWINTSGRVSSDNDIKLGKPWNRHITIHRRDIPNTKVSRHTRNSWKIYDYKLNPIICNAEIIKILEKCQAHIYADYINEILSINCECNEKLLPPVGVSINQNTLEMYHVSRRLTYHHMYILIPVIIYNVFVYHYTSAYYIFVLSLPWYIS
jgi:hypothetical protein